jgi:hypothetical protein
VNVTLSLCTSISVVAFVYSDVGMFEDEGADVFSGSGGVFLQEQRNIKWCSLKYKEK